MLLPSQKQTTAMVTEARADLFPSAQYHSDANTEWVARHFHTPILIHAFILRGKDLTVLFHFTLTIGVLKWIWKEQVLKRWTGCNWLRIDSNSRFLWTRLWYLVTNKKGNSGLADWVSDFTGVYSMDLRWSWVQTMDSKQCSLILKHLVVKMTMVRCTVSAT